MNIKTEDLLNNSFVISINDRIYDRFCNAFLTAGLKTLPKKFNGFTLQNKDYSNAGFIKTNNICNCSFSHIALVKYAQMLDLPFICIFEDDAIPCKDILFKLNIYLFQIPDNTDILKLGVNTRNEEYEVCQENPQLLRMKKSWGSHAYIIFKRYYNKYIQLANENIVADSLVLNYKHGYIYVCKENLFIQYNEDYDSALHGKCANKLMSEYYSKQTIAQNFVIPYQNISYEDIECPKSGFLLENSYVISVNDKKLNQMYEWFDNAKLKRPILFKGTDNCDKSHYYLTKMIMEKNLPYVTIFEDDAYPMPNILERIKKVEQKIIEHWNEIGIVQLGKGCDNGWHKSPKNKKILFDLFFHNEYTWNAVHALFFKRSQYQNRLNSLLNPTKILNYNYMKENNIQYNYADRYTQEFFDKYALIVKDNIFGFKDIISGKVYIK